MEVHFIELPVFRELAEKALQTNPLHRWLFFLDYTQAEAKRKELAQMDAGIAKALEKLEYLSSDKDARALQDAREDALYLVGNGPRVRSAEQYLANYAQNLKVKGLM